MRKVFLFILVFVVSSAAFSQKKIKYKDLFPLLNDKKYMEAEADLKAYLSVEKNQDEGNPNYQMGLIYHDKFIQGNILGDTVSLYNYGDSATYYFKQAVKYIDDRELRKNDEYYQVFYRRDLRTGEFGIKLSDVHLEIENLVTAIAERKGRINKMYLKLESIKASEVSAVKLFNDIVERFSSRNQFLMAADLPEISELGTLADFFQSIKNEVRTVREMADELELRDQFNDSQFQEIPAFTPLDPIMDPFDGTIETWDFDKWVTNSKEAINGEIAEYKRQIIQIDKELAEAKEYLENSNQAGYPSSVPTDLFSIAEKYGADTAPLELLKMRVYDNIYTELTDTLLNRKLGDSSYVSYQLQMSDTLLVLSNQIYDISEDLKTTLVESENQYAAFFSARYEGIQNAFGYVDRLNKQSTIDRVKLAEQMEYWDFRNNWGLMPMDTIPLVDVGSEKYDGSYDVWQKYEVPETKDVIVAGVQKDTVQVFVARFGSDRRLKWKVDLDSDLVSSSLSDSSTFLYDTIKSGDMDLAFYTFKETGEGNDNILIFSISYEGELNWANELEVLKEPVYSSYNAAIKQHTIFFYPQEEYPLPGDELGYIVIDRNGEAK